MHNNFFFFRKLTSRLETALKGSVISECFSQNKDELIIRFETVHGPFILKASLIPSFSCLSFPENFHRARKNSVDLFSDLIGHRVMDVRQFNNERSFAIQFNSEVSLLFKMHGNRSNCVLFHGNSAKELFNQSLENDLTLQLSNLDRDIDWSFEAFQSKKGNLQSLYFTFGKVVWRYLDNNGFNTKSDEEQWTSIQGVVRELENPNYYILEIDGKITFSLLPTGRILKEFKDPLKALNDFFLTYNQTETFSREKSSALGSLKSTLRSSENYFEKTRHRLDALQRDNNYKVWADIIMANLGMIDPGRDSITLPNFYDNDRPCEIKLKKGINPQKNAEVYYAKSKKQQIEMNILQEALVNKSKEIESLRIQLQKAESIMELKSLRELVASDIPVKKEKQADPLPYHQFDYSGYAILVGKNAQSNDKLTQKHSYKEDLWLHAKDVSGSHVIVKYQAGKKFPKDVIEKAAQLAAYYSKRKKETLCPVIVTPRKFVRKRKGDPAGMVVVEKSETILVEPKL